MNTRRTLKYLPEKGDIERESFPKMVERGDLMSYPYYGDWWYIDSVKDIKTIEDELRVR
jgi:NDP-sugar pyrophosphorylase family protein